jgi:hypothetical protein
MADYNKDIKNKNTQFGGTEGILVPKGGTGDRPSAVEGILRYNTDLGFLEQYNAAGWAGIDAPPTVSSVSGTINEDSDSTITVNGSNFKSGSSVVIQGAAVSGTDRTLSTTFINSGQLTAATNASSVNYVGGQQFNIKVINPSGLSAVLEPGGTVDRDPIWSTGAGSVGTIYDGSRTGVSIQLTATDADSDSVSYSVISGSLPSGLSMDSSGLISGNANAVGSDTTSSFTVRATANGQSEDRAFSITVKQPVTQTYSNTSEASFTVPTGLTSINVELWGAGGGGGGSGGNSGGSGNGGQGAYVAGTLAVSGGQTFAYRVGGGGNAGRLGTTVPNASNTGGGRGGQGQDSSNGASGGTGGGFSYIKLNGTYVVIAAGGGAGGGFDQNTNASGATNGGNGGYANGSSGTSKNSGGGGGGGGGGSQNSGGSGGSAGNGASNAGGSGGQYQGGNAGSTNTPNGGGGGGGGGGYYGGGGGGGSQGGVTDSGGAGGGGGSSYYSGALSGATATNGVGNAGNRGNAGNAGARGNGDANGTSGADGKIIISY